MLKKLHLSTGLLMMLVFVLTGQYLNFVLPPAAETLDGNRMMYRAGHIYLMMAAAINIASGINHSEFTGKLALWLQRCGACLLLGSQALLFVGFMIEPGDNSTVRLYTQLGCFALFAGIALVFVGWSRQPRRD